MDPLYIYLTYYFRTTDIEYFTDPINSAYFKLIVNSTDVSNFYNFYIRDMAMWDKNGDYWTFFENISFDEDENMYIYLNKPYTKIIKRKRGPNKQYTIQFHSYNCKTCCKNTVNFNCSYKYSYKNKYFYKRKDNIIIKKYYDEYYNIFYIYKNYYKNNYIYIYKLYNYININIKLNRKSNNKYTTINLLFLYLLIIFI